MTNTGAIGIDLQPGLLNGVHPIAPVLSTGPYGVNGASTGQSSMTLPPAEITLPLDPTNLPGQQNVGTGVNVAPVYGTTTTAPGVTSDAETRTNNETPGSTTTGASTTSTSTATTPTAAATAPAYRFPQPVARTNTEAPEVVSSGGSSSTSSTGDSGGDALAGSGDVVSALESMLSGYSGLDNPLDGVQTATQGALESATPVATPTSSTSNPALIIAIVLGVGAVIVFLVLHARKKKTAPAPSTRGNPPK